jgi:hypothetical protein
VTADFRPALWSCVFAALAAVTAGTTAAPDQAGANTCATGVPAAA